MAEEQSKDSSQGAVSPGKKIQIRGTTKREVASFARELSVLIDVGMPLLKSLRVLARRNSNPKLSRVISEIAASIEKGTSLADALGEHPKLFDNLFVNVVKVGESGGVLDQSLRRLANFLEEQVRIRNKVFYAMMYPCVVVFLCIIAIFVIVGWVVPTFMEAFPDVSELPLPTRIVYAIGTSFASWWWLWIIIAAVIVYLCCLLKKGSTGRRLIDRMKIKLPGLGRFGTKIITERVTTTLATLIRSGIPILDALRIVGGTADNVVVEEAFLKAADDVEKGQSLADSLEKANVFNPTVVDMIAVGDEAGALDVILEKVSSVLKDEIDYTLEGLTAILEPVLVVILGIVIIFIALSVFLPYWTLGHQIYA